MARQGFAHLTELDPSGSTGSKSGDIDNKFLICLGYWGNHHYFNLTGEKRNAAIQVYQCTEHSPQFGMLLFSSTFFSKNFADRIGVATAEVKTLCERLAELERKNVGDKVRYYLRQALQLGTTGVVGAGAAVFAVATRNAGFFTEGCKPRRSYSRHWILDFFN